MSVFIEWISQHRSSLIVLSVIVLAFLALRTQATALPDGNLSAVIGQGQPVVLEFYTNT